MALLEALPNTTLTTTQSVFHRRQTICLFHMAVVIIESVRAMHVPRYEESPGQYQEGCTTGQCVCWLTGSDKANSTPFRENES